jgi:hypothetical protein
VQVQGGENGQRDQVSDEVFGVFHRVLMDWGGLGTV